MRAINIHIPKKDYETLHKIRERIGKAIGDNISFAKVVRMAIKHFIKKENNQ